MSRFQGSCEYAYVCLNHQEVYQLLTVNQLLTLLWYVIKHAPTDSSWR